MYNDLYIVASKINVKPYMGLTHFSHKYDTKFHTYIRNILFLGFLKTLQIASVWQHIWVLSFFSCGKQNTRNAFFSACQSKEKNVANLELEMQSLAKEKEKKKVKKNLQNNLQELQKEKKIFRILKRYFPYFWWVSSGKD